MDFWNEIDNFEKFVQSSIGQYNALDLRAKSQLCALLLETSKFSMNAGRPNRAWAFLLMARKFWSSTR